MNNIAEVKVKSTPQTAYEYIRDNDQINNKLKSKLEKIIAKDAEWSFLYAYYVLKAPFPEGKTAIAKKAEWSFLYAYYVLKTPFPAGEAAIAQYAYWSYKYAKYVLKKSPFLAGVAAIARKIALWAAWAALFLILLSQILYYFE